MITQHDTSESLYKAAQQIESVMATLKQVNQDEYSTHLEVLKHIKKHILLNLHKNDQQK